MGEIELKTDSKNVTFIVVGAGILAITNLQTFLFKPKVSTSSTYANIVRRVENNRISDITSLVLVSKRSVDVIPVKKEWYI